MPNDPTTPGVSVEAPSDAQGVITGVETSVTAFAGRTPTGSVNDPTVIEGFAQFEHLFGGLDADLPLTYAVRDFFQNGGTRAVILRLTKSGGSGTDQLDVPSYLGSENEKTGIYALLKADIFNLLCIPPDTHDGDVPPVVYQAALTLCVRQKAFLIVDPPAAWTGNPQTATAKALAGFESLGLIEPDGRNGAIYFPRVKEFDAAQRPTWNLRSVRHNCRHNGKYRCQRRGLEGAGGNRCGDKRDRESGCRAQQ